MGMAASDGAGGRSRGLGRSKHAGVTDWHVEIDSGHMWVYGSVDLGNVSSVGGQWQKKEPGPVGNTALMQVMDNVCHAEFTYMARASVASRGGGGHRMHTALASTWGWSVMAGGSGGGRASVPGRRRLEGPTTWTRAARPSYYLWLSTGSQWEGGRGRLTFHNVIL